MKKVNSNTILLVIILSLFGVAVGIHLDSNVRVDYDNLNFSINRDVEVQEMVELKKTNQEMRQRIIELKNIVENHEKEITSENIVLKKLKGDVDLYQLLAGYRGAVGEGITITLEGIHGENIAQTVEEKTYLFRLINELRFFGAEVIAVNDYRITGRSEVTVAGSHLNVNGHPIAPPYQIKAIGDQNSFKRYIEHGTLIFEYMTSDGIRSSIQFEDSIEIPAVMRERPIEFLKPINEL